MISGQKIRDETVAVVIGEQGSGAQESTSIGFGILIFRNAIDDRLRQSGNAGNIDFTETLGSDMGQIFPAVEQYAGK